VRRKFLQLPDPYLNEGLYILRICGNLALKHCIYWLYCRNGIITVTIQVTLMAGNSSQQAAGNSTDTRKCSELPDRYSEDWLAKLDGRTAIARVIRDRLEELQNDLGGRDQLSYQQRSLAKRAIWLEAIIEQQEIALSRGEEVDQGKLTQAVNSLIGLLKTLGLQRRARDLTPSLREVMQG